MPSGHSSWARAVRFKRGSTAWTCASSPGIMRKHRASSAPASAQLTSPSRPAALSAEPARSTATRIRGLSGYLQHVPRYRAEHTLTQPGCSQSGRGSQSSSSSSSSPGNSSSGNSSSKPGSSCMMRWNSPGSRPSAFSSPATSPLLSRSSSVFSSFAVSRSDMTTPPYRMIELTFKPYGGGMTKPGQQSGRRPGRRSGG